MHLKNTEESALAPLKVKQRGFLALESDKVL